MRIREHIATVICLLVLAATCWFGVFYLSMGIALVAALGAGFGGNESRVLVMRRNDDAEGDP